MRKKIDRYYYHITVVGKNGPRERKQRGNFGISSHFTLGRGFAALAQLTGPSDHQAFIHVRNKNTDEIVITTGAINLATLYDNLVAHTS